MQPWPKLRTMVVEFYEFHYHSFIVFFAISIGIQLTKPNQHHVFSVKDHRHHSRLSTWDFQRQLEGWPPRNWQKYPFPFKGRQISFLFHRWDTGFVLLQGYIGPIYFWKGYMEVFWELDAALASESAMTTSVILCWNVICKVEHFGVALRLKIPISHLGNWNNHSPLPR